MSANPDFAAENAELHARLEEAEETLRAIRTGEVDALMIGDQVYTLEGAETPYRVLIEQMYEGAATLSDDGTVLYANRRLGDLLKAPLQDLIGSSLRRSVTPAKLATFDKMLAEGRQASATGEFNLQPADGSLLPVQLSFSGMAEQDAHPICVVVTDLTQRKQAEVALLQAQDTLEQRVRERTAELQQANKELAHFNQAMVGRELRMIEMKNEINALCAKLGQPPRYPA
jgi:PAS domain S-box-containing protein